MSLTPRTISTKLRVELLAFFSDMDRAAARLRQYGHEGASAVQPLSNEFRNLGREGAAGVNAVGGAMAGMKREMQEFFRSVADAPERMAAGWRSLNSTIHASGEELRSYDSKASALIKRLEALGAVGAAVAGIGTAIGRFVAASGAEVEATAGHASAIDNLLNMARTARLVLSPTIFTAAAIAAGALVEEIGRLTIAQGDANEKDALFAHSHDISIEKTQQLSFVVRRLGGDIGTFLTALGSFQNTNPGAGIPEFGKELERLGNISDPVERVKSTLAEFGDDVGTHLLPYLDERFSVNAQRVADWGVSLDKTARENIGTFRKDMHDFALGFEEDADLVALAGRKLGLEVESGFSTAYVAIRTKISESVILIDSLTNKLDQLMMKHYPAGGLFPPDKLDVGAISKQSLTRSEGTFTNSVMESMAPNAASLRTALQQELDSRDKARFQSILDKNIPLLYPQSEEETKAAKDISPDQLSLIRQQTLSAKARLDAMNKPKEKEPVSDPFGKALREQEAAIDSLTAKLAAIGKPEAAQLMAEAFGEARKQIERVNEELLRLHKQDAHNPAKLTLGQEGQLEAKATRFAALQAEDAWQTKFQAGTVSIGDRVKALEWMTEAIDKGYEASRNAAAEAKLLEEFGARYDDKKWLSQTDSATGITHQAQMDTRRAQLRTQQDREQDASSAEVVKGLNMQIQAEKSLAVAQMHGAEAVRQATLESRLRELQSKLSAEDYKKQEVALRDLYAAERETANSSALAQLDLKIEATDRLTAAILRGSAAVRQANLENKEAEIAREGDAAVPGLIGIGARGLATAAEEASDHARQVAEAAAGTRLQSIDNEIAALQEALKVSRDRLGIEMQLRDLENQRIHALAQETLALGGARDGVKAFFIEMQANAKRASDIIYETLNSSLDRVAQNLGKLMTGQKTDWAKTFQQEGQKMVEASAKSMLENGLGKLGKALGIKTDGKADGSAANPFWVRTAGAAAAASSGGTGGGSIPGVPHGVFQGSGGGGIFSLVSKLFGGAKAPAGGDNFDPTSLENFGGWEAEGGAVDPGYIYGVNDGQGREFFQPSTAGRIIPGGGMGGDIHFHSTVNAPNSELGMMNRIERMIEASHKAAVSTAVQAMHERSKRVPGGR